MRIIKALLVLVFLLPTLAAAQPTPESFIRIERDENREPVALQTAIAKYVPVGSATGVEIDLVAVVHIGEQAYYRRLNRELQKYDAVLYELVAPEGTKPTRGGERNSDNPLAMLQQVMKLVLRLEHQLEVVDYGKTNFIHADLSLDGLRKAMKDRGEDEMTVILKVFVELMQKMREGADKPGSQAPDINLLELLLNPSKLKRIFAEQLVEAGGDAGFGRTFNQLVVIDRNKACLEVLKQQFEGGQKEDRDLLRRGSHAGLRQAPQGRGKREANHQRVDRRLEPKITSRGTAARVIRPVGKLSTDPGSQRAKPQSWSSPNRAMVPSGRPTLDAWKRCPPARAALPP
jgi:hypothetical protein